MALAANTVWNVRTDGSDSNGGSFVLGGAGTDYSLQAASQFSGTNLASVSSLVVSSATHNFVSTDVDNTIQISGGTGFTAGFYRIVSVAANQATLDRSPGTVGANGVWAVGGALATFAKIFSTIGANAANGFKVNLKGGTYTLSAMQNPSTTYNYVMEGYQTNPGDNPTGTNRPLVTTSTNSINLFQLSSNSTSGGIPSIFRNLRFTNTATTRAACFGNNFSSLTIPYTFVNCYFSGFTRVIDAGSNTLNMRPLLFDNCEVTSCTDATAAIYTSGDGEYIFIDTCVHNNTGDGFRNIVGATTVFFISIDSTFYSNGGSGFQLTGSGIGSCILRNSNFVSNTADGFAYGSSGNAVYNLFIENCIFYGNGGWGINVNTGFTPVGIHLLNNAFGSNTSGTHQYGTGVANYDVGDITLGADPFTAKSSGDFSLNWTSNGGVLCRAAGFPGILAYGGTGYIDVGALQHQDTPLVVSPRITQYIGEEV